MFTAEMLHIISNTCQQYLALLFPCFQPFLEQTNFVTFCNKMAAAKPEMHCESQGLGAVKVKFLQKS